MSSDLITQMIEAGCIEHNHYVFGKVHTDNNVTMNFVYDFKIADQLNLKLYNAVHEMTFDNIVSLDPSATLMAFPISMMCKRKLYSPGNIEGVEIDGDNIIIASILYDAFELNQIIKLKDLTVKAIVCVTNYSGLDTFEGIPIIELVKVNTWDAADCPYCKDEA